MAIAVRDTGAIACKDLAYMRLELAELRARLEEPADEVAVAPETTM